MQPHPDIEKFLDLTNFSAFVFERKYDGVRTLYDPFWHIFYSRQGTRYENFDVFEVECDMLAAILNEKLPSEYHNRFHLDGEVCGIDFKAVSEQLFRISDIDTNALDYMIFDIVIPDFCLKQRKALLRDAFIVLRTFMPEGQVKFVDYEPVPDTFSRATYKEFLAAHTTNGEEGIVFKDLFSLYDCGAKRKNVWVKGLPINTEDLLVTSVVEGKGKLAGCVGVFMCGEHRIAPGKATQEQLKFWWEHPEERPTVIEVSFKNKTGAALRHPRFVRARFDKSS